MKQRDVELTTNFPTPDTLKKRGYVQVTPDSTLTSQEQPHLAKKVFKDAQAQTAEFDELPQEPIMVPAQHDVGASPESKFGALIPERAILLREAEDLICSDRNKSYGHPMQNFTNIAAIWNIQFGHMLKDGFKFEPQHVAQAQISVKLARMVSSSKRDNYVDIAGYAACGYEADTSGMRY